MPQITVNRKPNGKADVPPGTVYTVVAATPTTLTIEVDRTPAEVANEATIEDRLRADLAAMQAILGTPNAQMDTATIRQAIKAEARTLRRLVRYALAQFDGAD